MNSLVCTATHVLFLFLFPLFFLWSGMSWTGRIPLRRSNLLTGSWDSTWRSQTLLPRLLCKWGKHVLRQITLHQSFNWIITFFISISAIPLALSVSINLSVSIVLGEIQTNVILFLRNINTGNTKQEKRTYITNFMMITMMITMVMMMMMMILLQCENY